MANNNSGKSWGTFIKKRKYQIIAVILMVGGGYYWYQQTHKVATAVQYKTTAAEKGKITTSITGSGNVIVDSSANIDPTITGTVASLAVNIGDKVKKGQTLFTIVNDQLSVDADQAQVSYAQARGSLQSAKASKKQAQYDLNHNHSGMAQKNILEDKLSAAKISLDAAEQNVIVAESKYRNALSDSAKRNVVAPISGTVNAINVKNGDDLSKLSSGSSRTVPMIIGDLNTMKAQVQVNEVDISNVSIGQKTSLTFSAIDGLTATGKVEKMDSIGTLSSGVVTYNVTISFDSLDQRIKPEMSVSASIITGVKQDVLLIPNGAVKTRNGATYVQVLKNQAPENKNVEVGLSNNTQTEIVSGINVGDKVVTQTIAGDTTASSTTKTTSSSVRIPGLGSGRPD
jgi:RND family efflux transporter MFP subunit